MSEDRCEVDLSKTDVYSGEPGVIPDQDVETCLKVLRTIRNWALFPGRAFDADAAVVLSHAHKYIVELVQEVINTELKEYAENRQEATRESNPAADQKDGGQVNQEGR